MANDRDMIAQQMADVESGSEIVSKNKDISEKLSSHIEEGQTITGVALDADEKEEARRTLQNPVKMKKVLETEKTAPQKNSLGNKFALAFAAFTPTLLGALFEGSEGAAAAAKGTIEGAKAGVDIARGLQGMDTEELRQKKIEQEIEQAPAELELKQEREERMASQAGLAQQRIQQAEERLDLQRQEIEERQDRFLTNFNLKKTQAAQLSDAQVREVSELSAAMKQAARIPALARATETGPLEGRIRNIWGEMNLPGQPDFVELKAQVGASLAAYVKSISGAQVSEQEARRLETLLPNVRDNKTDFFRKLNRFNTELNDKLESKIDTIAAGQKLKQETAKEVLKETKKDIKELEEKDTGIPKAESKRDRLLRLRKKYGR